MEWYIAELVEVFYTDCAHDGRKPNEADLRAWLWFSCPARLRSRVEPAIHADDRWPKEN